MAKPSPIELSQECSSVRKNFLVTFSIFSLEIPTPWSIMFTLFSNNSTLTTSSEYFNAFSKRFLMTISMSALSALMRSSSPSIIISLFLYLSSKLKAISMAKGLTSNLLICNFCSPLSKRFQRSRRESNSSIFSPLL